MPQTDEKRIDAPSGANTSRRPAQVRQDCQQYFGCDHGLLAARRSTRERCPPVTAGRRGGGSIRASTAGDREAAIGQRLASLAVFAQTRPEILAALRVSRQAARSGARSYDPVRHAALCRLAKARRP